MKNNAISLSQPPVPAARPTVLIVDDSRLMRVAIKKILKDEFELIEAVDGEDAWSRLEEEPAISCIFSDLSMPNLDGYGLLARVRGSGDAHIRALPFIVITGKEGDLAGLLEEVRGHGATDLVGKPFKSDEIIARTRSLLAAGSTPETRLEMAPAAEAPALEVTPVPDQAVAAEAQARREAAEAEARRVREEQEAARRAEEARRREAEEAARREAAEAQARREAAEAEARRAREEQEAARRAEEAARQAAEQAEQERLAAEAAARQAEEEARICAELRAKARLHAEERERQRLAEERALRLNPVQRLFLRLALPFLGLGNGLLRLGKDEALEKLRKRLR